MNVLQRQLCAHAQSGELVRLTNIVIRYLRYIKANGGEEKIEQSLEGRKRLHRILREAFITLAEIPFDYSPSPLRPPAPPGFRWVQSWALVPETRRSRP